MLKQTFGCKIDVSAVCSDSYYFWKIGVPVYNFLGQGMHCHLILWNDKHICGSLWNVIRLESYANIISIDTAITIQPYLR